MSHSIAFTTPAGTPWTDRTVGELVAERPGRSRVFQSFQIDFCCQGARTLGEACQRVGVSPDSVIEQLEAETATRETTGPNPADLSPTELVKHIVAIHHAYLRREFPRLRVMAEKVARVHGSHTPTLLEVWDVYQQLEAELLIHLEKEEQILFPAVTALDSGDSVDLPVDGPIACMMREHEDAGGALVRLRELTHGYQPPVDACNTYRALFAGLLDLETDLHRHIHLENSVLFPAAHALATRNSLAA